MSLLGRVSRERGLQAWWYPQVSAGLSLGSRQLRRMQAGPRWERAGAARWTSRTLAPGTTAPARTSTAWCPRMTCSCPSPHPLGAGPGAPWVRGWPQCPSLCQKIKSFWTLPLPCPVLSGSGRGRGALCWVGHLLLPSRAPQGPRSLPFFIPVASKHQIGLSTPTLPLSLLPPSLSLLPTLPLPPAPAQARLTGASLVPLRGAVWSPQSPLIQRIPRSQAPQRLGC